METLSRPVDGGDVNTTDWVLYWWYRKEVFGSTAFHE